MNITQPQTIATWHAAVANQDFGAVEGLIADDATFYSPAVHSPQIGKPLVVKYLRAAMSLLNNESFRYVDEWYGERSAVLEFELTLDGTYVNGIDLIRWNTDGKIVRFKVMVRPLKGLNTVLALMGARLQAS
jgi:hypothetical protein